MDKRNAETQRKARWVQAVFITENGKWNLEQYQNVKVTRYMNIYCDESESQLIQKDIPNYESSENKDESDEESDTENKKTA